MTELVSIAEAGERFRAGSLCPSDLVEQCLERIERFDGRVHAWVVVDKEAALRTAHELDRELAAGRDRGPLHGIPVGVKDIIDVASLPTQAGSPLRRGHVAAADAPLVAALRKAGAVVLGKTVTVEFACFDPSPSRNPWSPGLRHTPGGSSSGSAVAVALGMCLGALGTQTGGSLVRPASYCGVATLKPTYGRCSLDGVVPVSYHLDHPGPLARRVADLAAVYGAMRPEEGRPCQALCDEMDASAVAPRLGRVRGFFAEEADAVVREAFGAAIGKLSGRGAAIHDVPLPDYFADVLAVHGRVMAVEAAAWHRDQFAAHRDEYGPKITSLLDEGLATSGVDYAAALDRLRCVRRHAADLLDGLDALIMPATDTTAPPTLDTTGDKKFQAPWSCSGLPVVSLPCGLAADGMPAAIQFIGRPDGEWELLRVARWCEERFDFAQVPPLLGP